MSVQEAIAEHARKFQVSFEVAAQQMGVARTKHALKRYGNCSASIVCDEHQVAEEHRRPVVSVDRIRRLERKTARVA